MMPSELKLMEYHMNHLESTKEIEEDILIDENED
jgi:hypothetical protein